MTCKLQSYDRITKRIVDPAGAVVGLVQQLANDRWGLYDTEDRRLTRQTFAKPADALKRFNEGFLEGEPT